MTPHQIFLEFKKHCPNSREQFNPTQQNVIRWRWHIEQLTMIKNPFKENKPILRPTSKRPRQFERRKIERFEDFPPYMRDQWGEIASHFPGIQVWACGSRVAGDFVEPWNGDEIRQLRAQNFKPDKLQSDFDFWIEGTPEPIGELPKWADWVRGPIPENEKIKIQMWDFSKLPKSEHAAVLFAYQQNDVRALVAFHDKYQLSPYNYCCEMDGLLRWYKWAVDGGMIVAEDGNDAIKTDHQLG